MSSPRAELTVAVPKGRILTPLLALLEGAGIAAGTLVDEGRALVRSVELPDLTVRFLLLKPDDVPTYVEYGAADLGVCGRDVLDERGADVYRPLDLAIGRCRLVVAGPKGLDEPTLAHRVLRVATKYPRLARRHFAARGRDVEVINVQGSVELGPLTGLSDVIVDLVESGRTLEENGLEVREEVLAVSSQLVANRAAFKWKGEHVAPLIERLRRAVGQPR